jgi:hypothetical protein
MKNKDPFGYWLFKSASPRGSGYPRSSFLVLSKEEKFYSGSLQKDYKAGSFEIDKNDIIACDPTFGNLETFEYNPTKDLLYQNLTSEETGFGKYAYICFKRISIDDFKSIAIKHLSRIKGVGKVVASHLVCT